jgi:hypothetical protein
MMPGNEPSKKADATEDDRLYKSPGEALKKVTSEYEYWSGKLTETSLQMCYALIGANWVVFGSLNGILNNAWAKMSMLMVILALGANIVGAWLLSESLRKRVEYGEGHKEIWKKEYDEYLGAEKSAWPFTDGIQDTGRTMRIIKGVFTLLAGALLIVGAILK